MPAYRFIAQDVQAHLTRLDKGELLLSHPIYRQPVKIEFPPPTLPGNRARVSQALNIGTFVTEHRRDWRWWVTPKPLMEKPIHRWYVFPHSFTSELVHTLIEEWGLTPSDRILDPFVGAGTTLLAAREKGIPATGYDLLPLATLAARVKVDKSLK